MLRAQYAIISFWFKEFIGQTSKLASHFQAYVLFDQDLTAHVSHSIVSAFWHWAELWFIGSTDLKAAKLSWIRLFLYDLLSAKTSVSQILIHHAIHLHVLRSLLLGGLCWGNRWVSTQRSCTGRCELTDPASPLPCLPEQQLGQELVLWDHKCSVVFAEDLGADESLGPHSPKHTCRRSSAGIGRGN